LDIVIVADGLEKLSCSAREYLLKVFGLDAAVLEDATYDQTNEHNETLHHQIFISDRINLGEEGTRACVLLKRFNHRKINSHEWFFKAHAPNTRCPYGFTTDCGALFRPGAVEKLITHLNTDEQCAAITARLRVMSEYNHRILGRTTPERDTWLEWALRLWQGYDFELGEVSGKAADCAGGLTLCLHGPCAMFRLADIQGKCLEEYFDHWGYAPPHSLSLCGANLQLGEDRILSLLSATESTKHLTSLFDVAFEFDPEMDLQRLVTQRRRWRNATLASTYYTLTQVPSIMRSNYTLRFKLGNLLLLGARVFEHSLCLVSPAIFAIVFISSAGKVGGLLGPTSQFLAEAVQAIVYATLYTVFVYVHLKRAHGDCVLQPTLVKMIFVYTIIMSMISFGGLVYDLALGRLAEDAFKILSVSHAFRQRDGVWIFRGVYHHDQILADLFLDCAICWYL
jgi:cellulose synthase/poly-beta-1,6-N-acetylglucosamine synthase-like glycosyltransferase